MGPKSTEMGIEHCSPELQSAADLFQGFPGLEKPTKNQNIIILAKCPPLCLFYFVEANNHESVVVEHASYLPVADRMLSCYYLAAGWLL